MRSKKNLGNLITANDAAKILSVSLKTIRRKIQNGEIQTIKFANFKLISIEDLRHIKINPRGRPVKLSSDKRHFKAK